MATFFFFFRFLYSLFNFSFWSDPDFLLFWLYIPRSEFIG